MGVAGLSPSLFHSPPPTGKQARHPLAFPLSLNEEVAEDDVEPEDDDHDCECRDKDEPAKLPVLARLHRFDAQAEVLEIE